MRSGAVRAARQEECVSTARRQPTTLVRTSRDSQSNKYRTHYRGKSLGISPHTHEPLDWHSCLKKFSEVRMCARYLTKALTAMAVSVVLGGCRPSGVPLPPSAKLLEGLPAVTASV